MLQAMIDTSPEHAIGTVTHVQADPKSSKSLHASSVALIVHWNGWVRG
jgi:hypothetical protein